MKIVPADALFTAGVSRLRDCAAPLSLPSAMMKIFRSVHRCASRQPTDARPNGSVKRMIGAMKNWLRSHQIGSTLAIWLVSVASGVCVLGIAIFLQWLVYNDWMHLHAPQRWVGSLLASGLAAFAVLRWQFALRRRRLEMLHRFETIRWMNDRIRNALQTIELLAFAHSQATEAVSAAVDAIEDVLHEVLAETQPNPSRTPSPTRNGKTVELEQ
jgi:hypothetical protein